MECLIIGVLWSTNNWRCWVDLANRSDSGRERIALSDVRILSWQVYKARTLSSIRNRVSLECVDW